MKTIRLILLALVATLALETQVGAVGYWARMYDPNLQRWIQRDSTGERGGIDLYQFVFNSPINAIDPDGAEAGFIYRPGGGMENVLSRKFNPPADPVSAAKNWIGFTDYSFFNPFDDPKWYFRGIKCNKFVGDCISECPNRPKPLIKDPVSGKMRYPLAQEWFDAEVTIPGYGLPHDKPLPGDVVTDGHHLGFMDTNGYIEAPTYGPVKFLPFNNPLWNPGRGRTPLP